MSFVSHAITCVTKFDNIDDILRSMNQTLVDLEVQLNNMENRISDNVVIFCPNCRPPPSTTVATPNSRLLERSPVQSPSLPGTVPNPWSAQPENTDDNPTSSGWYVH